MNHEPDKQIAAQFEGFDNASDPTKLPPGLCSEGLNMWCKGDGYVETRPGTRLNADSTFDGSMFGGLCYWDQPSAEQTVMFTNANVRKISSAGNNVSTTVVVASGNTTFCTPVPFLDRVFWLNGAGVINFVKPDVGAPSFGTVTTFSDGTIMPAWSRLVVQNFRLLAFEPSGEKLYASAVGAGAAAANWVKTDNIRVGDGDGDPARALIAGQAGYVLMLCGQSCWQIDISDAAVANWTTYRVTKLAGCIEGRTAIAIGQDVFFLARHGIVSLGALALTDSISPSTTLSAPIKPYIDLIDWASAGNAFATKWRDLVLFALPLVTDSGYPRRLFPYNLTTKRWQAPWYYGGPHALGSACVARFGQTEETILGDIAGRLLRIDDSVSYDEYAAGVQTSFESWAQLRRMDHGVGQQYKQPLYAELTFQGSTGVNTRTALNGDGTAAATASGTFSDGRQVGTTFTGAGGLEKKRYLARNLSRYREGAIQVWADSGKLKLREAALSSFIDPPFYT